MPNQEKLKKLAQELKRLQIVSKDGETAGVIFDLATKLEGVKELEAKFDRTVAEIKSSVPDLNTMFKSVKGNTGEQGVKGDKGDKGDKGEAGKSIVGPQGLKGDKGDFVKGEKGDKGDTGERGLTGLNGADGSPDQPETIVAKLESIDEEDDKLKIEAIRNLRKELDDLKKEVKSKGQVIYGGGGKSRSKVYDLSSKLDGATKTFGLPAFWEVTGVVCSSFPNALRPVIDYSTDSSTITFTSEIDAASTLAVGQTVLIFYTEP